MKFSLSDSGNHNRVRRYTDNSVTIRNDTYTNSIIVTQEAIIHPWPVKDIADINEENLLPALDCKQSIWLLGTG
ncbi:MAG: hypothetical protein HOM11_07770, partial [Methylococcales bacterium]|nr:hypothetical protein [Methylococcales bacterium]